MGLIWPAVLTLLRLRLGEEAKTRAGFAKSEVSTPSRGEIAKQAARVFERQKWTSLRLTVLCDRFRQCTARFGDIHAGTESSIFQARIRIRPSAFIRYAVLQELSARKDGFTGAGETPRGERGAGEERGVPARPGPAVLFAYLDTLRGTADLRPGASRRWEPQSVARVKERHDRLLKTAGAMAGNEGSPGRTMTRGNSGSGPRKPPRPPTQK
jgi:hypothetical protein